jgi:hypothetical protein
MAFITNATALAIAVQSAVDVPATVTSADALACYDVRPGGQNFTLANPEYTGTVDRAGDSVVGRDRSVSFNVVLKGPGGSAPPALNTYILGRILRAARFAETSQATPLLASTALGGAGTTSTAILSVGASAVDDFYNGLPIIFSDQGAGVRGISMVKDYIGGSKTAHLMETFAVAPAANFSIPAFLGYRYNASAPELYLSVDWWLDKKRYKMVNATVSSLNFNFPTTNRGDTANTFISVTLTGDVHPSTPELDETAPIVSISGGAVPFRDGDFWIANKKVCGSSMTVDMGFRTGNAPCQNNLSGGEATQILETRRTASFNINEVLLSVQDYNNLANLQGYHGAWAQYGNTTGKVISFGITEGRLGFSEADPSGDFVTRNLEMYVDNAEKTINLVFPYF